MLGSQFSEFVFLPSIGASGGILVAWKQLLVCTGWNRIDNHLISVQFGKEGGSIWWLTCVYGPQGDSEKIEFLQELRDIRNACVGPWVLAGDFNLIYKSSDKNNTNINRATIGRFRRMINDLSLKEIPFHGRKFTWSNQQVDPVLVKLDRVFCSVDWNLFSQMFCSRVQPLRTPINCPLLLGLRDNKPGKRRFHFESFWTKLDGFQEIIQSAWNSVDLDSCPFLTLDKKLKETAKQLKAWSANQVGHVRSQFALAKEVLHRVEMAQDERHLTPVEVWLRNRLKKHCLLLSSFRHTMARLRSRIT
jgi:hypothetical protein